MLTPFGKILMLLDGSEVAFTAQAMEPDNPFAGQMFPHVRDVYLLTFRCPADGQPHTLICRPENPDGGNPDGSERLEMTVYDTSFGQLALGVEAAGGDYTAAAEDRGLRIVIPPSAQTMDITIGAAWLWGAQSPDSTETLLAADPHLWRVIGDI